MENFITTQDLESFWRSFEDDTEKQKAAAIIKYGSYYLRQAAKNNGVDLSEKIQQDETGTFKNAVKMVLLSAVKRAMLMPKDAPPVDQWSMAASPYSESMTFSNSSGEFYFKNAELQLIGLSSIAGKAKIGVIRGIR